MLQNYHGIQIGLMIVLLSLSAFFSGSETAFFSLNSLEKDTLRRRGTEGKAKFIKRLFSHPDEILATILTGNMFVNVFSSSIAEAIGVRVFHESAEILSIASMTVILLIVGEMTPKNLAIRHALKFASRSAGSMRIFYWVLKPVTSPLGRIRQSFLSAFPVRQNETPADQATAILSAIRMGYHRKTIDESELHLLERFFRFRRKTAEDVMVPRVDVHPVNETTSIEDLLKQLSSGALGPDTSLIPVYKGNNDHISGYVRRMDLVALRITPELRSLKDIIRPVHAVPSRKKLRELLDEMGKIGTEMATVIDEYGGIDGLVSFPGLVAYLFEDFLPQHERSIERTGMNRYRIAGQADINEVATEMNIKLMSSHKTIAGMLIDEFEELPAIGRKIEIAGFCFQVSGATDRKITWIEAWEIKE